MTTETDRLISRLVAGLEPTTRLPRLRWMAIGILLMGGAMVALKLTLSGLRLDVRMLSMSPSYAAVLVGLLLISAGGLASALGASIPGRQSLGLCGIGALVGGTAALVGAALGLMFEAHQFGGLSLQGLGAGLSCLGNASLVAAAPALALGVFVLRAAPHHPLLALCAAAGGAAGIGASGVHLSCPSNGALHVLTFHALAPLLGGGILWLGLWALKAHLHPASG